MDRRITITDAREFGDCIFGLKAFAIAHNLDWKDFIKNGLPASKLLETGDAMAIELVNYVNKKAETSNG